MFATPAVAGDLVFVGSCSSVLYALDTKSGKVVWKYDIRQDGEQREFHADPVLRGPALLVGTDYRDDTGIGHVYSFDQQTGSVRWKRQTARGFPADFAGSQGQTYAVTFAGELLALDDESGSIRWKFGNAVAGRELRRPSSPAASQDTVYYGSADGHVFALDAATGAVRWTRALGSPIETPLTLWGKTASFGTEDRRVCRLDARDGSIVACRSFDELPAGKPLVAGDSLIILFGSPRSCCASLVALDSSLRTRWIQTAPEGSAWDTFRPIARSGEILIGSDRGELFAFRLTDGAKLWSRKFGGPVRSIGSGNGILYVGTLKGTVYAYEPKTLNGVSPDLLIPSLKSPFQD